MESPQEKLTPAQAFEKIKHYCAYTERCHTEVRHRLFAYGLNAREADTIIAKLIEENFLNEERFAIQFAGGHFRLKKWGRIKIIHALRSRSISEYCIKIGLQQIEPEEYQLVLKRLAATKWQSVGRATPAVRWSKTRQFLLQRGFESGLVQEVLRQLERKE